MVRVSLGMITALAASSMTGLSLAHPGEHVHSSHIKRQVDNLIDANYHAKRALDGCQGGIQSRALMARAHERRAKIVADLRRKRGITNSELAVPYVLQYKINLGTMIDCLFRAPKVPQGSCHPSRV